LTTLCYALVLIGPPSEPSLTPEIAAKALACIPETQRLETRWLDPGRAWQALFVSDDASEAARLRDSAAKAIARLPIDVNVVPDDIAWRRKRLLVADMESTIIEQEMLDELAGCIGQRERVAAITERAMRGELDFAAALRERVALLAGLDARVLDAVAGRMTPKAGAGTLVRTMRRAGAYCALVSGGFTVFTERVAGRLGFQEHQANTLEIRDGRLTGRVVEPILGREAKLSALERLRARMGLRPQDTLAVGDGANDLAMLAAAGLGVAFRAKPVVREQALALPRGAVVTHGDLTALLYLQGYSRDEFAG
jgi:phosphoserine phosphatase